MAILKTFGADVLSANVEARQAYHESRTNLSKLGVRKVVSTATVAKKRTTKKAAATE